MRLPRFTQNRSNAGRAGLWHLYENAFIFVADHVSFLVILYHFGVSAPACTSKIGPENFRGLLLH